MIVLVWIRAWQQSKCFDARRWPPGLARFMYSSAGLKIRLFGNSTRRWGLVGVLFKTLL